VETRRGSVPRSYVCARWRRPAPQKADAGRPSGTRGDVAWVGACRVSRIPNLFFFLAGSFFHISCHCITSMIYCKEKSVFPKPRRFGKRGSGKISLSTFSGPTCIFLGPTFFHQYSHLLPGVHDDGKCVALRCMTANASSLNSNQNSKAHCAGRMSCGAKGPPSNLNPI
jgi:hypothetical protein